MPCYDDRPTCYLTDYEHQTMTRLACDYCKSLEAAGKPIPEWAVKWWGNHKRMDAEKPIFPFQPNPK